MEAMEEGALAWVWDLAKGFRASQSLCGVGWGNALQISKEDFAGAIAGTSRIRSECSSKDVWWEPFPLSEATKVYPPLKLRVLVD